jgi:hypothetical protein
MCRAAVGQSFFLTIFHEDWESNDLCIGGPTFSLLTVD